MTQNGCLCYIPFQNCKVSNPANWCCTMCDPLIIRYMFGLFNSNNFFVERYPLDQQVTVYYNTEKPGQAVLEHVSGRGMLQIVIGILLIFAGIYFCLQLSRDDRGTILPCYLTYKSLKIMKLISANCVILIERYTVEKPT